MEDKRSNAEVLLDLLLSRQQAYQQVFNPESVFVKTIVADLERFCRANESSFHQDPRIHALIEGRREVYLRIMEHVKLSPDELRARYGKGI